MIRNIYHYYYEQDSKPSMIRAAYIAPFVAPLAAVLLLPLTDPFFSIEGVILFFPFIFLFSLIYAYVGVWFFGVPAAILLARWHVLSAIPMYLVAVLTGEILGFLPQLIASQAVLTVRQGASKAVLCGGVALTVAVLFCVLSGIPLRKERYGTNDGR